MDASEVETLRHHLRRGQVIPAHPLALTAHRRLDERHQRALTRYYIDAGAGGIAVGVHTTQFAVRSAQHRLLEPVLELAAETARARRDTSEPFAMIGGVMGETRQAVTEAAIARDRGYDLALLSLGALGNASESELIAHCGEVAQVLPLFGFYLQPAVGGRLLSYRFWRQFADIPEVWAIKIAPFNRYQTLDVIRAVVDAGRDDIALYTGNDDNIIADLLTPFPRGRRIVGGLLGQWAVWTHAAVQLLRSAHAGGDLEQAAALTDANAAIFDAANGFAGCIPGIHEVLRRQGLLRGTWCLDPAESLSPGQSEEIDRVLAAYPDLSDDLFVKENLDRWLA